jgi:hypothetical protein
MRLVTPARILFFVLLLLPAEEIFTQSTSQVTESLNFVSVKMSSYEFASRQLQWLTKHPDLASHTITRSMLPYNQHDKSVSRMYQMSYPTLDIYSSAGVPLYFSDSPEVNVKVIDALPQVSPEPDLNPKYQVRPSMREALSMIPAISLGDRATPPQVDYTIFVVSADRTNLSSSQIKEKAIQQQNKNASGPRVEVVEVPSSKPDAAKSAATAQRNALANQAQTDAIQRLKTRLQGSRIRVIELHLEQ